MRTRPLAVASAALVAGFLGLAANAEGPSVRTPEAIQVFNEVCGKTYPTFEGAEARARAIGFPMGAKNPSKLLSVYAFSNSRGRRGCSVQYSTVEAEHTLNKNIRLLDGFQVIDSDNGVARFRNTKHFIEVSIRPPKGGRTVVDIRLEFESQ